MRSRSSWRPRLRREMVDERWSTDTQLPDPETLKRGSPSGARLDHAPWTWKANSPTRAAFAGALACAGDAQGINKQGTINAGRRIRCCLLKLRSRAGACSPMSDRCCWCAMLLLPLVTRLLPSSSWSSGLHVEAIVQACLEGPTSALPTEAKGPIVLERRPRLRGLATSTRESR